MLLKWTREVLPDVKLVIIEPFALLSEVVQESWIPEINERRAVARKLADEFGAVFIPAQSILDEAVKKAPGSYWLRDGVHPTPAGHHLLARAWIEATENIR